MDWSVLRGWNEEDAPRGAELRKTRSLCSSLQVILTAQLHLRPCVNELSLSLFTLFWVVGTKRFLTQHILLPCISYFIFLVIIFHQLLRIQSQFFKYLVLHPLVNLLYLSINNLGGRAFCFPFVAIHS